MPGPSRRVASLSGVRWDRCPETGGFTAGESPPPFQGEAQESLSAKSLGHDKAFQRRAKVSRRYRGENQICFSKSWEAQNFMVRGRLIYADE